MTYFYGRLFAAEPEISAMFPAAMDGQRHRFYRALYRLAVTKDEGLDDYLAELGRAHRLVSNTLVHHLKPADTWLLGSAEGRMTVDTGSGRPVLCPAGGTGLAPLKAIAEAVGHATESGGRRTSRSSTGRAPRRTSTTCPRCAGWSWTTRGRRGRAGAADAGGRSGAAA